MDFRWFFAGRAVANLGDQVSPVALAFAVLGLTRNPGALGLVLAAQLLPEAGFVLLGGAVADRWDRRKLMIITDLVRFILQGLTAALLLTHVATVPALIALQAGYGAATAFFSPTGQGFLTELVAPEQLQTANSLNSMSISLASIIGPAVGGGLVAFGSPGAALAVDAASFAISAAALTKVRVAIRPPRARTTLVTDLMEGWREFTGQTWIWVLVAYFGGYQATVSAGYDVLGPAVSKRFLGGAGAWAAILTARGVGAVIAGGLALRLRPRRPMLTSVLLLLFDAPLLLLLARHAPTPWAVAAAVVEGGALGFAGILWYTALQERVPGDAQSRVFAYDRFGSIAMRPVGLVLIGALAAHTGAGFTLMLVAGMQLVATLAVSTVRSVRTLTGIDRDPTGSDAWAPADLSRTEAVER